MDDRDVKLQTKHNNASIRIQVIEELEASGEMRWTKEESRFHHVKSDQKNLKMLCCHAAC